MDSKTIVLDGSSLKIRDIQSLVNDPEVVVEVADAAAIAVNKSKAFLDEELNKRIIYGVNTGFGPMASHIISEHQLISLQENLIRSHAVGMGEPIDADYVLSTMVVRLNTLAKGFSGVSYELIEHLKKFINYRITPIIPEHGAVGASGDLVQLSHIALALMGEGEVVYKGKREEASGVLAKLDLYPYKLKPKEGLALINGTSAMAGIAALLIIEANRVLSIAVRTAALALELVHGFSDCISKQLQSTRPHHGQMIIAKALRQLLASSCLLRNRNAFRHHGAGNEEVYEVGDEVQGVYSLRCTPQILGPVFDALLTAKKAVEIEINSVTDNPIIDYENKTFLHGGNFHGDYIAYHVDALKITFVKLTLLSERRVNFFLNHRINRRFPPFLNLKKPGLTLALQGLQFVATSTAAENQTLAFPHYVHSISTNADNQDVVSMGADAARLAARVIENAYVVLALELVTLAQAVDVRNEKLKLGIASKELFEALRNIFPAIEDDRVMISELNAVVNFLKTTPKLDVSW